MTQAHRVSAPEAHRLGSTLRPVMVFIAPNDFEGAAVNLGAAAKIASLVRIFGRLGFDVHYVDTSHWTPRWAKAVLARPSFIEDTPVTLWRPFQLANRKAGKLLNVLAVDGFFAPLRRTNPALVWIYNSYAMEGALAQRFASIGVPFVLELEDLPRARRRGWNPKPLWDQRYLDALLPAAALVTFVNQGLLDRYADCCKGTFLLPSVLHDTLAAPSRPKRFVSSPYRVGYFGGLVREKGAQVMLDALAGLPAVWQMVVTGAGELGPAFQSAAQAAPDRLEFHGAVSRQALIALMQSCDVIVNPHHSIKAMHDGVFPFKVCEAIASGALLLTTPLPSIGESFGRGAISFDGSAKGLQNALADAYRHDQEYAAEIDQLRARMVDAYSELAVARRLAAALAGLPNAGFVQRLSAHVTPTTVNAGVA